MRPTGRLTGRAAARWVQVACLLGVGLASAQEPPADQLIEISAKPLTDTEQRRRDPVARTVYGREELERYGDVSVGDAMKRLPGVTVQGGSPRLRGLGAGYTQLLVNGEPAPPGFSLDNVSPGQVERIEITRGPSAEYSAQAVAGTVNIVLRELPRTRQRELSVRLGYQAVRPTISASGSWGDRIGEGAGTLSYTVPAAVYQWRGQADTASLRQSLDPDGALRLLDVTGVDRWWGRGFNIGPRLSWKLDDQQTLDWRTFAQRHDYDNRGRYLTEVLEGSAPISVDDQVRSGGTWQMLRSGLTWQRKAPDGTRTELRGGFQASSSRASSHTDGADAAGTPTLVRDTTNHNTEHSLSAGAKHSRPLGEAHTLVLGWDGERRSRTEQRSIVENGADLLPGFEGLPFEADLGRLALFAQDEWELAPRWSASLGLRGERIVTTSEGQDGPLRNTSQVITPLLHVNHRLDAAGKDLIRASLTRSYKAPELNQLISRPSINPQYPANGANTEIYPDSIGNPALDPELATGLDLAYEQYLPQGGVLSVGGFYRRISGVIRNQVTLQAVPWAAVPRWVSQPVNLSRARSAGLELELKGRGDELLTALAAQHAWLRGLSLRGSANVYRSSVDGIPGPDNRLAGQPPWTASAGFDQALGPALGGPPLTVGASLAWTPGYRTQQTPDQSLSIDSVRSLDAHATWAIDRQTTLRLAASNLLADGSRSLTEVLPADGAPQFSDSTRSASPSFGLGLTSKF